MVYLSDKGSSESEDMSSQSSQISQKSSNDRCSLGGVPKEVKTCVDCGTSKTPLWRGGPAGPKSLCNACGIKSRKKRRALLGLNKEDNKAKKSSKSVDLKLKNSSGESSTSSSEDKSNRGRYGGTLMKKKLFGFGKEVVALQRPRSNTTQRRKFGEVEQAAILLMALSCGSVYA
ncbi:hypothetical protein Leryth_011927 [Lithospermum erythrorhizon]|uniref:GATA-type domain-containing protein n=1 Tax=Lithospermum erythrorhizon TaxID=34254 RepID=A0AAV3P2I9_LITER|nr:hypothetical protein Leryth_011927 [Lithospermum erythrorhizon]